MYWKVSFVFNLDDDANKQLFIWIHYRNFTTYHQMPHLLLLMKTVFWSHLPKPLLMLWKCCINKLKLIMLTLSFFFFRVRGGGGVKIFWPVQNNETVLTAINKLNNAKRVSSVSTFNFSPLYTKMPLINWNRQWKEL